MRFIAMRAVLVLGLGLLGCAHAQGGPAQGAPAPAPEEAVVLSVSNNTWSDAEVYVVSSTMRGRLGSVASMNTLRAPVPHDLWALGWLQVRVDPVGGGSPYITDRIEITGGQQITLNVEKQTSLSTWVVDRLSRSW